MIDTKRDAAARGTWTVGAVASAMLALLVSMPTDALAQMGPDYWRVANVPANDTLNLRSGAGTNHRVVAVAPNGAIFRNLGCRGEGSSRWCHLETPDGHISGWASGRYLVESGAPTTGNISGSNEVPELHVRHSGEIEVRFASGCTALYNPAGRRIAAGSSCSRAQLSRAHDAVDGHMRETAGSDSHEGGGSAGANIRIAGTGTVIGGGRLTGSVGSEMSNIHCTNGAHGTAILASRRSGKLMTFNLNDGTGGYVNFD